MTEIRPGLYVSGVPVEAGTWDGSRGVGFIHSGIPSHAGAPGSGWWWIHCAPEVIFLAHEAPTVPDDIPMSDTDLASWDLARIYATAAEAADWIQHGWRVLVTCREGLNRSCFVAARILRDLGDPDPVATILAQRPGALYNQAIRAMIAEWTA